MKGVQLASSSDQRDQSAQRRLCTSEPGFVDGIVAATLRGEGHGWTMAVERGPFSDVPLFPPVTPAQPMPSRVLGL